MRLSIEKLFYLLYFSQALFICNSDAQALRVEVLTTDRHQVIDGFGAHQGDNSVNQEWWQRLYYDDLGASIYRVDLTPRLVSPYSDFSYYSPWFMGSSRDHVLNLEDPDNPNGPEGNRARTYTGPSDYSRSFGGYQAPIAVMGPDIDENVKYFTYSENGAIAAGLERREQLVDFKLVGSLWSPVPWVKVSSGNRYSQNWWPGPVQGTPWPFIWGGNFAGGRLDVSDTPLSVFDDSDLGGDGPTSALTQFARSTAAYVRGYQRAQDVRFYAISIQNELNFEQFYNSATYPLSSQYLTAVKAIRKEFDKYEDLQHIRIMGPEDLLGGDAYGLWQYGGGDDATHKNLQYLQNIAADPAAAAAVDFFCIHGYDSDGVTAGGADPRLWDWWANGWDNRPAPGIPANVPGFTTYGKKSWMTETSGEQAAWLYPATGFPNNGGWSIALKIHQALTTGRQSAWIYWTFTKQDDEGVVTPFALTNQNEGADAPKYVGAKHFFRHIRPGAQRVTAAVSGSEALKASAYIHDEQGSLTLVLINTSTNTLTVNIALLENLDAASLDTYTSSEGSYWQASTAAVQSGAADITIPAYGVVTLVASGLSTGAKPVPASIFQLQHFPNPFKDQTRIQYKLPRSERVRLTVSDTSGKIVAVLADTIQPAGIHEVVFQGADLSAGLYYYKLEAGDKSAVGKLILTD